MHRRYSIKGKKVFQTIYKLGKRKQGQALRIITLPDLKENSAITKISPKVKIAITISKKYGKAWQRNKAKRRIRSILTKLISEIKDGFYIIISLKNQGRETSFLSLEKELKFLLKKSDLIN